MFKRPKNQTFSCLLFEPIKLKTTKKHDSKVNEVNDLKKAIFKHYFILTFALRKRKCTSVKLA